MPYPFKKKDFLLLVRRQSAVKFTTSNQRCHSFWHGKNKKEKSWLKKTVYSWSKLSHSKTRKNSVQCKPTRFTADMKYWHKIVFKFVFNWSAKIYISLECKKFIIIHHLTNISSNLIGCFDCFDLFYQKQPIRLLENVGEMVGWLWNFCILMRNIF